MQSDGRAVSTAPRDAITVASVSSHAAPLWSAWSARSPWPGHPAILPPEPRAARSDALYEPPAAHPSSAQPRSAERQRRRPLRAQRPQPGATAQSAGESHGYREYRPYRDPVETWPARPTPAPAVRNAPARPMRQVRQTRPAQQRVEPQRAEQALESKRPEPPLEWPSNFDDWMIDIVRRRALRLNSGARRRGVRGSVRAVDLAHILAKSADAQGRWICDICREPVTLNDLSFDHVIALADGGEHAAHNLVPAHRKCNEIKGSEKAQSRAHALDRWLGEWASAHDGATPRGAARYPATAIAHTVAR